MTTAIVKRGYARPPSFTDLLPWVEYLPDSRAFLLEDGISVGALFEIDPVGTEARTPAFLSELRDALQTAIRVRYLGPGIRGGERRRVGSGGPIGRGSRLAVEGERLG